MFQSGRFSRIMLQLVILLSVVSCINGHARLLRPPSRASMWRFGFIMPQRDYNDHQGFCGGRDVQHTKFGGKCGVCGDPWRPIPRAHERDGTFYSGAITETYLSGAVIEAIVEVTASHKGYFEFRLCPYDNPQDSDVEKDNNGNFVEVSQSCLNKGLLSKADGSGTRFYLSPPYRAAIYKINLQLPRHLHCSKCLFQWTYITGNSWGVSKNGTGCVGCGPQEQFTACADVVIKPLSVPKVTTTHTDVTTQTDKVPVDKSTKLQVETTTDWRATGSTETTMTKWTRIFKTSLQTDPSTKDKKVITTQPPKPAVPCEATGIWKTVPGMVQWCKMNCIRGFCPSSHCNQSCRNSWF